MSLLGLGLALRSVLTHLGLTLWLPLALLLCLRLQTLSAWLGWLLLRSIIGVIITFSMCVSGFLSVIFGITGVSAPFRDFHVFAIDFQPFNGKQTTAQSGSRLAIAPEK